MCLLSAGIVVRIVVLAISHSFKARKEEKEVRTDPDLVKYLLSLLYSMH